MSRRFFVVAALLVFGVCRARAGSVADLDRDNGLPNAQIGAPLSSFQGLEKTEDVGRWLTFKRPSDTLRYGKFPVIGITYNFFKEKLYSINLDVRGRGNVKGVIKLLEQQYGKDHSTDILPVPKLVATMEVREWSGNRDYCVFKSGSDMEGGVITFLDKPTWDQLQVPKKERLEAAKQMLGGSFLDGTAGVPPGAAAAANGASPAPDQSPKPAQ